MRCGKGSALRKQTSRRFKKWEGRENAMVFKSLYRPDFVGRDSFSLLASPGKKADS
jgi:hypothetical protein